MNWIWRRQHDTKIRREAEIKEENKERKKEKERKGKEKAIRESSKIKKQKGKKKEKKKYIKYVLTKKFPLSSKTALHKASVSGLASSSLSKGNGRGKKCQREKVKMIGKESKSEKEKD